MDFLEIALAIGLPLLGGMAWINYRAPKTGRTVSLVASMCLLALTAACIIYSSGYDTGREEVLIYAIKEANNQSDNYINLTASYTELRNLGGMFAEAGFLMSLLAGAIILTSAVARKAAAEKAIG